MKIVVIGAGPGGEAAARKAAQLGAQVTLVEQSELGGVCLNRGCIPSKAWLSYAKKWADAKEILGASCPDSASQIWAQMIAHKDNVIDTLSRQLQQSLQTSKIEVVRAKARFSSLKQISWTENQTTHFLDFDRAILACGSQIFLPPVLSALRGQILTSDNIFSLPHLPQSILIVGGGAIGCEFACLLNALGVWVTIVEQKDQLLPGEDAQVSSLLRRSFEKRGIVVLTQTTLQEVKRKSDLWLSTLSNGNVLESQQILACVGRKPVLEGFALECAQINFDGGIVKVNDQLQTSNCDIYAVGDVNGLSLFAHAASWQGEIAAQNALGASEKYDGFLVPRCLYTWPEVASVGAFLNDLKAQNVDVRAQRFFFGASGKALAENESQGFVQILSHAQNGQLLGAQMIGSHVTELLHIISLALSQKMTRDQIKDVIFAHPTLSEVVQAALKK